MSQEQETPSLDSLLQDAFSKCVNCGSCQSVCPVYGQTHVEGLCARGKLQLVRAWRDGRLPLTSHMANVFHQCGLCGRCAANCSNGVPTTAIFKAVRAELANAVLGDKVVATGVGQAFAHQRLLGVGLAASSLAAKVVPASSGLRHRLPMLKGLEQLTNQPVRPYADGKQVEVPGPEGAPTLALFLGCMGNLLFHDLVDAAISVFSRKYRVIIPAGQGCCGLPASSAGDAKAAQKLAQQNLTALLPVHADVLTTVCASCTFGLRDGLKRLGALDLAAKVRDSVEVLYDMQDLLGSGTTGPAVDVHVSCHLGGAGQTRLRESLFGVLKAGGARISHVSDRCCGGGGLLPVKAHALSNSLVARAEDDLTNDSEQILVTGCNGCRIQWLRHVGPKVRVVHPLELLA